MNEWMNEWILKEKDWILKESKSCKLFSQLLYQEVLSLTGQSIFSPFQEFHFQWHKFLFIYINKDYSLAEPSSELFSLQKTQYLETIQDSDIQKYGVCSDAL